MDFLNAFKISASGLTAQRSKINVIAENIANAETTRTADGTPYNRKMVILKETIGTETFQDALSAEEKNPGGGVEVAEVMAPKNNYKTVYNPHHPDADEDGYVTMPNIDPLVELSDMMVARRAYGANATVIENTKSMILDALKIGK
ncbi:MAG: flagellar basal body rod protein FlgC [Thermodesulfobacteriota bacterium]|nr:flagellar basal body rod protein FlgC [Thermodesulfobacteriota bacterium]